MYKGGRDSVPLGEPVVPDEKVFYYPGPNKAICLPAPGAGTEAMMDDHGFADLQQDYDRLEEGAP